MLRAWIEILSLFCLLPLVLIGCGGGGGGGGSRTVPTQPTTITSNGISQDSSFTATTPGYTVTGQTDQGVNANSSTTVKYRADGTIERVEINTSNATLVWDEASGDLIQEETQAITARNPSDSNLAGIINATDPNIDWEYQTFGVWITGRGTANGNIGALSYGTPSTGSAIPTSGTATFTGISAGVYFNAAGTTDYLTASSLTANVDFLNRSINLSTSNTSKTNLILGGIGVSDPSLNLTGTLSYAPATNSFSGNVATAGGMSGTSTGQFYGPNAEELGGVFSLTGAGQESFSGGYGAKR